MIEKESRSDVMNVWQWIRWNVKKSDSPENQLSHFWSEIWFINKKVKVKRKRLFSSHGWNLACFWREEQQRSSNVSAKRGVFFFSHAGPARPACEGCSGWSFPPQFLLSSFSWSLIHNMSRCDGGAKSLYYFRIILSASFSSFPFGSCQGE